MKKIIHIFSPFKFKLNFRTWLFFVVSLFIIGIGIYLLQQSRGAKAAWFNGEWQYRQRLPISNAGNAQTNYQIGFTLNTSSLISAGKMQSDCDDIRITAENGEVLPHWIEENNPGCNNTGTKIWTKVPSIPTTGTNIYIYYGNSAATKTADGYAVFPMFDDFADNNISNWTQQGIRGDATNSMTVTGGKVKGSTANAWNGFRRSYPQVTLNSFSLDIRYNAVNVSTFNHLQVHLMAGDTTPDRDGYDFYETEPQSQYTVSKYADDSATALISNDAITMNTGLHTLALRRNDSNSISFYQDSTNEGSATDSTYNTFGIISFSIYNSNNEVDYFFLRKYATTEPTVGSFATEEVSPGALAYWRFDEGGGSTTYDSQQGTAGTVSGAIWRPKDMCITGHCLSFDGTNDLVDTGKDFSWAQTDSFSISTWVNMKKSANATILGKGTTGSTWEYSMKVSGTTPTFTYWNTSGTGAISLVSNKALTLNRWHHIELAYDGPASTAYMYLDGALTNTQTGVSGTFQNRSNNLNIGGGYYNSGAAGYFPGFIDEVKIYNYARSGAEVKSDFIKGAGSAGSQAILGARDDSYLSDGLVGYWEMDETSWGTVSDASGNAYNGTANGNAAITTGKYGNGGTFDGTGDYINVGNIAQPTDFTISAWIKTGSSSLQDIFTWGSTSNTHTGEFRMTSGGVLEYGEFDGDWANITGNTMINTNTWILVGMTKKGSTVSLYVNGIKDSIGDVSNTPTFNTTVIGARFQNSSIAQSFNGTIDDVRVYSRVFDQSEIQQLYEWAPGPELYFPLDENAGTSTVNDISGNNYQGTMGGSMTQSDWIPGKYGSALEFDGGDDYISIGDSLDIRSGSDATFSFWYYNMSASSQILFSKKLNGNAGSEGYALLHNASGTLTIAFSDGSNQYTQTTTQSLSLNTWYYISLVLDEDNADITGIYLDGVKMAASSTGTLTNVLDMSNTEEFRISSFSNNSLEINGAIDDFRYYNYARNQKQIVQDMNGGHPSVGSPVGSPLVHYKLDEGYGTTVHNNGNQGSAIDGTISGATWTNDGKFGKALSFDGTDDYVNLNNNSTPLLSATGDWTISTWVKPDTTSEKTIFAQYVATVGNGRMLLRISASNPDKFELFLGNDATESSVNVDSRTSITTGEWYHVLVQREGKTFSMYINGKYEAGTTDSGTRSILQAGNIIGGRTSGAGSYSAALTAYFDGTIDEFKAYNYALTSDEIKTEYNQGKSVVLGATSTGVGGTAPSNSAPQSYCVPGDTSTCSAPVGEWLMDENTGTTLYDTSNNQNNGSFGTGTSSPTWTTGVSGEGIHLDGNDFVSIPDDSNNDFSNSQDFTVSVWFKAPEGNNVSNRAIVEKWSGSGGYPYVIRYNSDETIIVARYDGTNNPVLQTTATYNDDKWHQAVFLKDGSTLYLYLDGIFVNSTADTTTGTTTNSAPVWLGKRDGSTATQFTGSIDQLRIYNYARTPAQIMWEYNKGAPTGWYKMDECEGTTIYNSAPTFNDTAAGNNGTLTIGATGTITAVGTCTSGSSTDAWYSGATGKRNASVDFDGSNDYINFGDLTLFELETPFTLSAWINRETTSLTGTIMSKYTTSSNQREWYWAVNSSGGVQLVTYPDGINGQGLTTTQQINTNTWYHLVTTFDTDGTVKHYINGQLDSTSTFASTTIFHGGGSARIGHLQQGGTNNNPFNGKIDDVRIYNYALTSAQVKTLYNNGTVSFQ